MGRKKPVVVEQKQKKRRRFRPGTQARREIKKLQRSTDLLIRKKPFREAVRATAKDLRSAGIRFTKNAIPTLHLWMEQYLVNVLQNANKLADHRKQKTAIPRDVQMVLLLTKEDDRLPRLEGYFHTTQADEE